MTSAAPRDELADLRRRAYGPDGAADDADLDRLQHLEDALRETETETETGAVGEAAVEPRPDTPTDLASTDRVAGPAASADVRPESPSPSPSEPLRRTLRRRRVLVVVLAVALLAAFAAVAWVLTRDGGTVLRRLAQNDTAAEQSLSGSLVNYGLDADSYVQFESFEGLAVWTARIPERGVRCLLIVDEESVSTTYNGLVNYSCTPEGLVPSVDVTQYETRDGELGERPVGSVARFVFLGDRVEVTAVDARDDPEIPTPAPR